MKNLKIMLYLKLL